jgi:hypothetical protein
VPTIRWFPTRGRETTGTVVSKVKYLGMVLDANGATAESLRERVRAAMARLMEMVDAWALVRGMRPAGAAHCYGTLVSPMWRHDVFLTPISPADTKTINDLDLLFVTRALEKVSYTEGECEDPAISTAIGFAYATQKDTGQLARQNVAQRDGRGRDGRRRQKWCKTGQSAMYDRCLACNVW